MYHFLSHAFEVMFDYGHCIAYLLFFLERPSNPIHTRVPMGPNSHCIFG